MKWLGEASGVQVGEENYISVSVISNGKKKDMNEWLLQCKTSDKDQGQNDDENVD